MARAQCHVLLVFPRFEAASFWSMEATCQVAGRRAPGPPLGLITVAALLPPDWNVRLVDRNAEALRDDDLAWADLVMTGGMMPQRPDTIRIIELCRAHGKLVAVGGPDVSSSPEAYAGADFRVIGEAETVMATFARAWTEGVRSGVFKAELYATDVTTTPIPRFDLLKLKDYVHISVQFSRGCPFNCEFCDIIELYGRVPRTKTITQMLAELDALYRIGYRGIVNFVDDNLIGNKKAVKGFLPHLVEWQRQHGYPFDFFTQATVNLADDDDLLKMMRNANFGAVFIGIESPNTDTLMSMQKKQNARRNLVDCVHKIYGAGIGVWAGFILGFDSETGGVADEMIAFIEATAIPICMVGLLIALPNTQLSRRLIREKRLHSEDFASPNLNVSGDQCTHGLNFDTIRPRREILADYKHILEQIYDPAAFFTRARHFARLLRRPQKNKGQFVPARTLNDARTLGRLLWQLTFRHPNFFKPFFVAFFDCASRNPAALPALISEVAMYLHVGPYARYVVDRIDQQLGSLDIESDKGWIGPEPVATAYTDDPETAVQAVAALRR